MRGLYWLILAVVAVVGLGLIPTAVEVALPCPDHLRIWGWLTILGYLGIFGYSVSRALTASRF